MQKTFIFKVLIKGSSEINSKVFFDIIERLINII